jgi:V/A-type H+-transporting ATPase subunit B
MGFRLSKWDEKLLRYSHLFEDELMNLNVNCPLIEALDKGWKILAECFEPQEVGIKQALVDKYFR